MTRRPARKPGLWGQGHGLGLGLLLFLGAAPIPALAFNLLPHGRSESASSAAILIATRVQEALDEKRYVDAGEMLDQASVNGVHSPELTRLNGELQLARGRFDDALALFTPLTSDPGQKARALQGVGIAQSMLGRSDKALAALKSSVDADPTLWRAWNALGREYDLRRQWDLANDAYQKALTAPGADVAAVLNNRGYHELLQNQLDSASADFVAALGKNPGLGAARTNLRITLAMEGHYDRASMTGAGDDRAAVLNNIGLAAAMRGDFIEADKLLNEAIVAKGAYYAKAADNLQFARDLAERKSAGTPAANGVP